RAAAQLRRHLLQIEAGSRGPMEIDEPLLQRLLRYAWPGNLRELRNVLRTMLALSDGDCLTLADFNESWLRGAATAKARGEAEARAGEDDVLGAAERSALERTLHDCNWNVSAAAGRLRLSRKTPYRKVH